MKKPPLFLLAALFAFISFKEKSVVENYFSIEAASKNIYVEYIAPDKKICIDNTTIYLTETTEEYDNPVSSIPSKKTDVTKKGIIRQASLDSLTKLIKSNGFLTLKKSAYGAAEEDRYYPYSIYVKSGTKEKKVIYRSNPSAASAPKEFSQIELAIIQLSKNCSNWEIVPEIKK